MPDEPTGAGGRITTSATRTPPRDARLLAELAASLEPERAPFYVSSSPTGHPDGWYWKPRGSENSQWLGRNVFWAEKALLERLRDG